MNDIDSELPPELVSEKEIHLMRKQMCSASSYLEFGAGGSTLLAINNGIRKLVTGDSDRAWIDRVNRRIQHLGCDTTNIRLVFSDIGPTGKWGYPLGEEAIRYWPMYYAGPWRTFLKLGGLPDLIYIDGRFRLACALYSILTILPRLSKEMAMPRIMIHDFDRPSYQPILNFASLIELETTLAVIVPHRTALDTSILDDLLAAQFVQE